MKLRTTPYRRELLVLRFQDVGNERIHFLPLKDFCAFKGPHPLLPRHIYSMEHILTLTTSASSTHGSSLNAGVETDLLKNLITSLSGLLSWAADLGTDVLSLCR